MMKTAISRREFIAAATATAVVGRVAAQEQAERGIRVRFLGSGASGWKAEWAVKNPNMRRQSSVLLENKVLIDFTMCSFDKLPEGCRPEALFQTHSHGDHYNPTAAVKSGVKRLYVQESWAASARQEVEAAAKKLGVSAPKVIALPFGKAVTEGGLRITGVPANHSTGRVTDGVLERTSLYLVEKGPSRLLYATDTGGIPGDAAWMIGIDTHINQWNYAKQYERAKPFVAEPKALTAFIMEATSGDLDDDFRLFVHTGVPGVKRIVDMLTRTGRLKLPKGQSAYITHLGIKYRDWPSEKIQRELPDNLRAAYDGLEVVLG